MNIKEFSKKMQQSIQEYYGENVNVVINEVTKNNGIVLEGMSIMEKEKNISPTIYLNRFLKEYEEGATFAACFRKVIDVYEENRTTHSIDMEFFTEYEKMKSKIVYKLINYDRNKTLLNEIPHIKYLDLAIVFYCIITDDLIGNATILIQNKHADIWGVKVEELYEKANINTPKLLPYEIQNMEEVMRQILLEKLKSEYENAEIKQYEENRNHDIPSDEEWLEQMTEMMLKNTIPDGGNAMYVLSNRTRLLGAACLLYQNVLEEFSSKLEKDFYILPSSIHELILIPVEENHETTKLNEMVREVNHTQVEMEEVLADHAYYYSRQDRKLSVV